MKINEFVEAYKNAKVQNTKINPSAVSEYLQKELEIKTYIPFNIKRKVVEMVVRQNTTEVNGVKKNDSISQYISFVTAMIKTHTNLEFSTNPVADYDLLSENKLLPQILAEFQDSYNECDALLKMALTMELEDNNVNVLVGRFLDSVLKKLDGVVDGVKNSVGNLDLKELLGMNFKEEDLAHLKGFLDRMK